MIGIVKMDIKEHGKVYGTILKDLRGKKFKVGDIVVRAHSLGRGSDVEIVEVTRIEDGKMYMGGSKVAVRYPGRMLIVNEIYQTKN